jgi:hypothetical protein
MVKEKRFFFSISITKFLSGPAPDDLWGFAGTGLSQLHKFWNSVTGQDNINEIVPEEGEKSRKNIVAEREPTEHSERGVVKIPSTKTQKSLVPQVSEIQGKKTEKEKGKK